MKKQSLILLLSFIFLAACSSDSGDGNFGIGNEKTGNDYKITNAKAYNDGPILLVGDSIANGFGASSEETSLVGCMTKYERKFVVRSVAEDGATSESALSQLENSKRNPSIVVISLGGNDVLIDAYTGTFEASKTYENIRKVFTTFIEAGSLVVHLGLNPPPRPDLDVKINTERLLKIKDIAKEMGVIFVEDSMKDLWGNPDLMADDLHPNDKGYAIICNRIDTYLKAHLK